LDYLDQVLQYAKEKTEQHANSADLHSQTSQTNILNLLLSPIKTYRSLFTAFALPNFIPLLRAQTYPTRRALASEIAQSLLRNRTTISSEENLDAVLEILRVLIKEGSIQPGSFSGNGARRGQETEETIEEQTWLARMVHLIKHETNDTQLKASPEENCEECQLLASANDAQLLQAARKAFAEGGDRIRYTTPALSTACLALARRLKTREHLDDTWKSQMQALFKFLHSLISALYTCFTASASAALSGPSASAAAVPELSLRLFLGAGQVADQAGFEEVSYEFFAQAFTVYEESISDSRAQFQAVCCFAGALHGTRGFGRENYDTLITKCALHGSKLLKKPDQCRAVCAASHLWWGTELAPGQGEEGTKEVSAGALLLRRCGSNTLL